MSLDNDNHQKYRNDRCKAQIKTIHKYEHILFERSYIDTSIYIFFGEHWIWTLKWGESETEET